MKRIALLSHRGDNIGHDFMAIGVEEILRRYFSDLEITHFEQHRHFSIYENSRLLRRIDKIPHGRLKFIRNFFNLDYVKDRLIGKCKDLSRFELAILCGGPNISSNVSSSPEMKLMLDHVPSAFARNGVKVIDIGAGAAFPLERIPSRLESEQDISLFNKLFQHVLYTTVREPCALKMWTQLGRKEIEKIPCAAFASGFFFEKYNFGADCVTINFQEAGANNDWGQGVDRKKWRQEIVNLTRKLIEKKQKVIFLCHSDREYFVARGLLKEMNINAEVHNPKSIYDYTKVIEKTKYAVVSRIHAAIPLAGCGVPSVVIGTDTRLFAPAELGLKTYFVKDATAEKIFNDLEYYEVNYDAVKTGLLKLREDVCKKYHEVFTRCGVERG